MGVTLTYDGNSKYFNTYFVSGFDDPDEFEFRVGINEEMPDGTLVQTIVGIRRIITVGIQVTHPKADRVWLTQFFLGSEKSVSYGDFVPEVVPVVLYDPEGFSTTWLEDLEIGRYFEIKLRADEMVSAPPESWATWVQWYDVDGNPMYDVDGNPIYVKV